MKDQQREQGCVGLHSSFKREMSHILVSMAAYNEEKNTAVISEKVSVTLSVLPALPHISAQKQHPSPAVEPGGFPLWSGRLLQQEAALENE